MDTPRLACTLVASNHGGATTETDIRSHLTASGLRDFGKGNTYGAETADARLEYVTGSDRHHRSTGT